MENFRLLRVLHGSSAGCTGPQTAIAAQLATPACIAPEQKCSPAVEHSTYKTCDSFTNIPNIASSLYASAPFIILKNGCESPSLALVSTLQYVYPFNTCFLNPAPYLLNTADSIVSMTITMDGGAVTVKSFADQYCEVASITNATVRLSNLPQKLDKGAFESPCFAGSFPYGVQFDLYNGDSLLSANSVTSTTEISSGDILQSQPPPLTSNISVQLPSNSTASGASGPSTPLLVGIAVAVFALVLFVVTLLLCRRTRNRTKTYSNSTEMLSKSGALPSGPLSTIASSESGGTSFHNRNNTPTTTGTGEKGSVLLDEAFTRRHLAGSDAIARAGRAAALDAKTRGTNGASEPPKALPQDPSRWTPVQVSEWVSRTQDAPPRMVQFILDQEMDGRAMLAFRRGAAVEEDGGVVAVALGTLGVRILFEKVVDEFKGMVAELEGRCVLVEQEEGDSEGAAPPPAYS